MQYEKNYTQLFNEISNTLKSHERW